MTDHGNLLRRVRLLPAGDGGRGQADHRPRGLRRRRAPPGRTGPGCAGPAGGEDDVSGGGAYTHMTMLAARRRRPAQPVPARLAGQPGGLLLQAAGRPRAARRATAEGLIATTGCPSGEVQTWLRIGDFERACAAAAEFRDIFGPENFFLELMDHGLDIERRVRDDLLRLGRRLEPAAGRHQRLALHVRRRRRRARGAAVRAVRHDDGRPEAVQVRRPRLLPEVAGRDARDLGRRGARRLRQHAGDRRADRRLRRGVRAAQPDAAVPGAGRRDRGVVAARGGRRAAWPGASRAACRRRTASGAATSST